MKTLTAALGAAVVAASLLAVAQTPSAATAAEGTHRYEGPSEAAIRQAASANKLPVDSITEVPVTLLPQ
ncbi:MAG TPA: hypothetical protein VGR86_10790 [Steroidobacteraceae bacterium]|nr:hypothetical protein [Steroidobacteraceae bacterium]